jgi:large subunit ribosomal protein L29
MDIDKVRNLTDAELLAELATQRRQLYDLRFQLATRQLTDHNQLSRTRRSIARILTVMTEREMPATARPVAAPPATEPAAPRRRRSSKPPEQAVAESVAIEESSK